MTTPCLPGLFSDDHGADSPVSRKRGTVPASSVEAGLRVGRNERARRVTILVREKPFSTSRELAHHFSHYVSLEVILWVRRGLSDALELGLVEHAGKRECTVAKTLAVTWKVKSR